MRKRWRVLIAALVQTTFERPPSVTGIPREERSKVVQTIEARLPELLSAPLSESVLTSLRRAWRAFLMCTLDTDALSKLKDTDAADLDEAEEEKTRRAAKQTAQRLAREGHVEAALQVFPPDDHPWRSRLLRVDVLQIAGSRIARWRKPCASRMSFPGVHGSRWRPPTCSQRLAGSRTP